MRRGRLGRNLTRLELVIAWSIIAMFVGVFTRYMLVVFARAERTMVNATIINMNTALKHHAAMAIMRGDQNLIAQLQDLNPLTRIQFLQQAYSEVEEILAVDLNILGNTLFVKPPNYIGELSNADPAEIEAGNWYFDLEEKILIYRIRNAEFFYADSNGVPSLKFKIAIDYNDRNGDHQFTPNIDEFLSIRLQSHGQYTWLI